MDLSGQDSTPADAKAVRDLNPESPPLSSLSSEDKQVVVTLYKTVPQLRQDFENIIAFSNVLDEDACNYAELVQILEKIRKVSRYRIPDIAQICRFAAAFGFAEQGVKLFRQIMKERGQVYVDNVAPPHPNHESGCVALLSGLFISFTDKGMDFRIRLARTGILRDMVEGLGTIQHLSGDVLDAGRVCFLSIGAIHNCCKHPEGLTVVKEMNIVRQISPFLGKDSHSIRAPALLLLAYIAEGPDRVLLQLDGDMLKYLLCRAEAAWTSLNRGRNGFETDEILVCLSQLSKLGFNRRIIVAKGALPLLASVLQSGISDEQEAAAAALAELAKDPENVKIFKKDRKLKAALERTHKSTSCPNVLRVIADVLAILTTQDDTESYENPALSELLAEQRNVLAILEMGEVEFVLDQLNLLPKGTDGFLLDVTAAVMVLQALTALAADDSCRREILARGGLDTLHTFLKGDEEIEILESEKLLLTLASCKEYCTLIQAHTQLMKTVTALSRQQDNEDLARIATQIVDTVVRSDCMVTRL